MKNLILTLCLTIGGMVYSQRDTTKTLMSDEPSFYRNSVGYEFKQFHNKQVTSIGLQLAGTGMLYLGATNNQTPLIAIGSGLMVLGFGLHLISYTHLNNAAILLDERGIGLAIKLKK